MQVLGELSTSDSTGSGAPIDSEATASKRPDWENARRGRRRGARVRGREFAARSKRARRRDWDVAALKLPDPLLTVPMALADAPATSSGSSSAATALSDAARSARPGAAAGRVEEQPSNQMGDGKSELPVGPDRDSLADTAEWKDRPVRAIDLSDSPKLIVRPDVLPRSPKLPPLPPGPMSAGPPVGFIPAPVVPGPPAEPAEPAAPELPTSTDSNSGPSTNSGLSTISDPSTDSNSGPSTNPTGDDVTDDTFPDPAEKANAATILPIVGPLLPSVSTSSVLAEPALEAIFPAPSIPAQRTRSSALDDLLITPDQEVKPSRPKPVAEKAPQSARFERFSSGRNELPDPVQLATEPSRLPEAMLAAVLGLVAGLAAWGTAAPREVWIPLAALPAAGLIALLMPGGSWARTARAGAMLAAAAALPVMAPSMTPVTLVVALAAVALYPMLISAMAGRVVILLAVSCLATPLVTAALTDGPATFFRFLLAADGDPTTAVRLALGSGILVVALVGGSTMAARRTLTRTASIAVTRERTARAATARLGAAASCDAGTGLPNRESLLRALTISLADSDRLRHPSADRTAILDAQHLRVGLVLIEIERFAQLADSLGSSVADDVAAQVAERLRAGFPGPAFLARVSRHQFALMLQDATADGCGDLAREVTALMTTPMSAGNQELAVTCSMGAVLAGPGLRTADELLQAADEAARAAQRAGRSRWVMFDQAVRAHALSQATLEIELREAIRRCEIDVTFQPILAFGTPDLEEVNGVDDRIVGAEVLARWIRVDGTVVEPQRFLPMADELGLGLELGMQVVRQALEALIIWRHEGVDIDQVWVNLVPSQLDDPDFAHEVAAQLAIRGLAPTCLVLEISAGQMDESEQRRSTLSLLRSLGIAVALDDFGGAGTSLSTLRQLPISAVKLDPLLAAELGRQDAVPRAMAQLCRTLGLRVVVAGVETLIQLRGAREIEADAVQGCAVARPMTAEDITNLLTLRLPRDFRLR